MSRTLVYPGRRIQVALDTEVLPDGRTITREAVLHPGAVAVLPLVAPDRVVLLQSHRPIIGETLWEVPAGTLEPNEPPADAAARELEEETGYRAARWRKVLELIPSPGVLSEVIHLYVAEALTPGPPRPEVGEQIEAHVVAWEQALAWTMDGTIRDGKTLIALLWWDRHRRQSGPRA